MIRHGAAALFQQSGALRPIGGRSTTSNLGRLLSSHLRKQPDFEGH